MKYLIFYLIICCLAFTACSGNKREKLVESIKKMEKSGDEYNPQYLDSLNILYEKFVEQYPKDSLTPKYLLSAGQIAYSRGTQDEKYMDKAIAQMSKLVNEYDAIREVEVGLFLLGNIYENNKVDTAKAREYYSLCLQKYPNGEYAESIKAILAGNLGKSAEEWIKKFEQEGKIDTGRSVKPKVN